MSGKKKQRCNVVSFEQLGLWSFVIAPIEKEYSDDHGNVWLSRLLDSNANYE